MMSQRGLYKWFILLKVFTRVAAERLPGQQYANVPMLGLAEAAAVEKEGAAKQQHPPSGSAESSTLASTDAGKGRTDATLEPASSSNPYQLAIDEFGLPVALQQQSEGASTLAAEETLAAHGTSMADLATAGAGFGPDAASAAVPHGTAPALGKDGQWSGTDVIKSRFEQMGWAKNALAVAEEEVTKFAEHEVEKAQEMQATAAQEKQKAQDAQVAAEGEKVKAQEESQKAQEESRKAREEREKAQSDKEQAEQEAKKAKAALEQAETEVQRMTEKEQKASTDAQEAKASLAKALTEAAESEKSAQDEIQDAKKEVREARKAEVEQRKAAQAAKRGAATKYKEAAKLAADAYKTMQAASDMEKAAVRATKLAAHEKAAASKAEHAAATATKQAEEAQAQARRVKADGDALRESALTTKLNYLHQMLVFRIACAVAVALFFASGVCLRSRLLDYLLVSRKAETGKLEWKSKSDSMRSPGAACADKEDQSSA